MACHQLLSKSKITDKSGKMIFQAALFFYCANWNTHFILVFLLNTPQRRSRWLYCFWKLSKKKKRLGQRRFKGQKLKINRTHYKNSSNNNDINIITISQFPRGSRKFSPCDQHNWSIFLSSIININKRCPISWQLCTFRDNNKCRFTEIPSKSGG